MGQFIHGRRRDGLWRYKIWSTVVDAYVTEEMDAEALKTHLLDDYSPRQVREGAPDREIPDRLARVHATGSSSRICDPVDVDGPWETERCERGRFHHAFRLEHARGGGAYAEADNKCGWCGEPREDHAHEPPCEAAEG